MPMHIPPQEPKPQTLWIIHFSMLACPLIYMLLVVVLGKQLRAPTPAPINIVTILYLTAIMLCFMGMTLPQKLAASNPLPHDKAPVYLRKRITGLVIGDALMEAAGIIGLVGLFLGFSQTQSMLLLFASLLMLSAQTPRIGTWLDEYRRRR